MTWEPPPPEDIHVPKRPSKNQKRKAAKRRLRSSRWDADRDDTVPVVNEQEISYLRDVAEEEMFYFEERATDEDLVALEAATEVNVE